ncbi:MAG: ABC transporter permease [Lentisphaeria bacterium]|nr:ABC transporter permease [Lentisphaeria bacterium]
MENESLFSIAFRRFFRDPMAIAGMTGVLLLLIPALYAPFIANGRPLFMIDASGGVSMPFLRSFFAPDSTEVIIEQLFNYLAVFLLLFIASCRLKYRNVFRTAAAVILILPFLFVAPKIDKKDYRSETSKALFTLFAPIPYGPFEMTAPPFEGPSGRHWLGADEVGRSVAARMIYGARASLAVGLIATVISMLIGATVGLIAGFYRNVVDLVVMRVVEILMCFPTFLLLLILMSLLGDRQFEQSILIVIGVIGLTGWIGLAFLVRGETLKQRSLPYVQSCEVTGVSPCRIMFCHLLPNITGPILISFTFGVAGAILAESGLSFLGFGVQPPTASWGGLLRQAFDNPLDYWHLTFFPGVALFIAVISFNFLGEGMRRSLDVK